MYQRLILFHWVVVHGLNIPICWVTSLQMQLSRLFQPINHYAHYCICLDIKQDPLRLLGTESLEMGCIQPPWPSPSPNRQVQQLLIREGSECGDKRYCHKNNSVSLKQGAGSQSEDTHYLWAARLSLTLLADMFICLHILARSTLSIYQR